MWKKKKKWFETIIGKLKMNESNTAVTSDDRILLLEEVFAFLPLELAWFKTWIFVQELLD